MDDVWCDQRGRPAVEFYRDRRRRWRFRIVGGNGEKQAASEPYSSRDAAKRGARDLHRRMVEACGERP